MESLVRLLSGTKTTPMEGNVLRLTLIKKPRRDPEDYKVGEFVMVLCPWMKGVFPGVVEVIGAAAEKSTETKVERTPGSRVYVTELQYQEALIQMELIEAKTHKKLNPNILKTIAVYSAQTNLNKLTACKIALPNEVTAMLSSSRPLKAAKSPTKSVFKSKQFISDSESGSDSTD